MAGCNFCHGLVYYSGYLYDKNHSAIILRHAFKGLSLFIQRPDIHPKAREAFKADISRIEAVLADDFLKAEERFREFSLGRSAKARDYRKWALANSLFLNPLNDVFYQSVVAHDVLSLPNMRVKAYSAPVFQGFFNQLKQEFISARYMFYSYEFELPEHEVHFSDKGRHLVNTLDYPQYGLRYENLKNAFKMAYSIFDKIGYFINEYFHLGIDRNKVYFRRLWYDKDGSISDKIQSLKNLPLRGLYFLSKDFYDSDAEYLSVADPEAKDTAEIRNHMEHKYFKIHWIEPTRSEGRIDTTYDELSFSIAEADLASKTLRLLKTAREALVYLSSAVHAEERKRSTDGQLAVPLMLFDYDDN